MIEVSFTEKELEVLIQMLHDYEALIWKTHLTNFMRYDILISSFQKKLKEALTRTTDS